MATTCGKPSPSIVARAAFLRSRKNAACSSGVSWICWRRLMAICNVLLDQGPTRSILRHSPIDPVFGLALGSSVPTILIAPLVLVRHRHLHRLVRPIGIREGLDTPEALAHGEVPAVLAGIAIVGDLLPSLPRPVGQHSADWPVFVRTLPDSSCLLQSMWSVG